MTHLGYLLGGWGVSAVLLTVYAVSVVRRGRALSVSVPEDQRRWLTSQNPTDG